MKKKYLLMAAALVMIVMLVSTSVAYFTATDVQENVFTVGDVKIELVEDKWDKSAEHLIYPGRSFDKNPLVKNVGNNPAYVRISVSITDYTILNRANPSDFEPSNLFDGYDDRVWISTGDPQTEDKTITYSYYYYQILDVNESTETLFDKITFPNGLNMSVINEMTSDLEIEVKAEAIQSDGFSDYEEAFEAFDLDA